MLSRGSRVTQVSPAAIYKKLTDNADRLITSDKKRANLDIVIDFHWFFLHSLYHKRKKMLKNPLGNWRYNATSTENLLEKTLKVIPVVASGKFPVVKFTNIGNVFSGERLIVIYSFPSGPDPYAIKEILMETIGNDISWSGVSI
ncbi:hypothetical protein ACFL03_06585 [Thermodesulfobacteriota bacterium]